jgi:hypothetical protein
MPLLVHRCRSPCRRGSLHHASGGGGAAAACMRACKIERARGAHAWARVVSGVGWVRQVGSGAPFDVSALDRTSER